MSDFWGVFKDFLGDSLLPPERKTKNKKIKKKKKKGSDQLTRYLSWKVHLPVRQVFLFCVTLFMTIEGKKIISHFDIQIASIKYQIPIEFFSFIFLILFYDHDVRQQLGIILDAHKIDAMEDGRTKMISSLVPIYCLIKNLKTDNSHPNPILCPLVHITGVMIHE